MSLVIGRGLCSQTGPTQWPNTVAIFNCTSCHLESAEIVYWRSVTCQWHLTVNYLKVCLPQLTGLWILLYRTSDSCYSFQSYTHHLVVMWSQAQVVSEVCSLPWPVHPYFQWHLLQQLHTSAIRFTAQPSELHVHALPWTSYLHSISSIVMAVQLEVSGMFSNRLWQNMKAKFQQSRSYFFMSLQNTVFGSDVKQEIHEIVWLVMCIKENLGPADTESHMSYRKNLWPMFKMVGNASRLHVLIMSSKVIRAVVGVYIDSELGITYTIFIICPHLFLVQLCLVRFTLEEVLPLCNLILL